MGLSQVSHLGMRKFGGSIFEQGKDKEVRPLHPLKNFNNAEHRHKEQTAPNCATGGLRQEVRPDPFLDPNQVSLLAAFRKFVGKYRRV